MDNNKFTKLFQYMTEIFDKIDIALASKAIIMICNPSQAYAF